MSASEQSDDRRAQGKGDSRDDGNDPAEDFEDEPDSQAADDAQATISEIAAEIEDSGGGTAGGDADEGEADSDETAESDSDAASVAAGRAGAAGGAAAAGGGVAGAEAGEMEESDGDGGNPDPGRYGLASNPEVLQSPFEHAEAQTDARDAGIKDGNTTADDMQVVEMEDGSRVFATPVSEAYPTMIVDDEEEAINNNIRSPKVIEALGGDSCKTAVAEGPDGETYITKEGVEGELVADVDMNNVDQETAESAEDTMAAAYFVGNRDLHRANMMVADDGSVTIIDNDAGGKSDRGNLTNINYFAEHNRAGADERNVKNKIFDRAHEIKSGEQDIPVGEDTDHYEYAHEAAEKAVRASFVDTLYDAPEENRPAEMQEPPDGFESISDFKQNDQLRFVAGTGEIVAGVVTNKTDRRIKIGSPVSQEELTVSSRNEEKLKQVVSIDEQAPRD